MDPDLRVGENSIEIVFDHVIVSKMVFFSRKIHKHSNLYTVW